MNTVFRGWVQVILALVLFVGGIVVISLRIPFWSLFLGIPSVQIGIIFIIFAFEKMSRMTVEEYIQRTHQVYKDEDDEKD